MSKALKAIEDFKRKTLSDLLAQCTKPQQTRREVMRINLDALTEGERFIVDWQYRLGDSFFTALAEAIMQADLINLERLERGFPDEVGAYRMFSMVPGWWDEVRKKAGMIKEEEK